jgi:AcrR family transcriptional regulator
MPNRQEIRSEETKRAILTAAGTLFADRGYDAVTMREIAKAAGCSHTTIYIYFKDKEALLHQLSMEPLQSLKTQMESVLGNETLSTDDRLKSITKQFIEFCLANRNMYIVFFMTKAARVDEEAPASELNKLRNQLFGMLRKAIQEALNLRQDFSDLGLAYARIYFFTLQGILATYHQSEESVDALVDRLSSTFNLAIDVLLAGFKETAKGASSK